MQEPQMRDYTQVGGQNQKSASQALLSKTYALLAAAFVPCLLGAYLSASTGFLYSLLSIFNSRWVFIIAFFAFFYGMVFMIEKNRYSNVGVALFFVLTFGLGALLAPTLQVTLGMSNGSEIVMLAAGLTAVTFFAMTFLARSSKINMSGIANFLTVGIIVVMVGVVANLFLQLPALSLTLSVGFVIISSLLIMWQTRAIIDGGEDSYISAALTLFISLYNLFSSLLHILRALMGED